MGKVKTVEERYQKKSQLEHILLRPDTYIGSTEMNTQQMWVFDEKKKRMVYENIDYVPGLYKIFDELLVNAADVYARQLSDPSLEKMTCIKVTIDTETGAIVVFNDGEPIPIQIHSEHNMYVPQLIFGELLTSDNYDDSEERVTGGRNGFGAKLANIFSKTFTVVVANKKMKKKFKMTWCENMRKTKGPAKVEPYQGQDFVKITFLPDYEKFNLKQIDPGTLKVLKKRVYDVAGTTGVKVYLNNERIKIKDFKEYVNLYLPEDASETVKVHDKMYRWEVVVSGSEEGFRQVSFVNSINTIKGGTHVSHVVDPLVQSLSKKVNSKNKGGIELKPNQIKNHIFIFINCQIVNPSFDSQTKETLTTKIIKFGSKYTMSEKALGQVLRSKIVDNILNWLHEKTNIELKKKMKVSSKGSDKLFGIPKLEDANKAGTRFSMECTLILTEGDSAKTSCLAGLSVVGRDKYGVFPLKGKLLNVREASYKQLTQNVEVQNILKIMGLDISNKSREDSSGLRYGSVMIMTDQDYDGSHIKGLLINLFHNFWPKLIQFNGFIREFVTPLIKVTSKAGQVLSFFTMEDFNRWKETVDITSYKIKYYKGLGTSSDKEFKEYFSNLNRHLIEFNYVDNKDDDSIDMAFSKKRIEDRKNWMQNYTLGNTVDHSIKKLRYSDFINKELIQFSIYDTERSIPSVIDGFKPGQRKVLFGCFKRNLKNECKVAQLTGYIAEHSAYHHGENSLQQTIVNMAQDFVGSNNLNLLLPCGQFGSRKEGGKDAAAARYIFTKLAPLTRYVFLQEDDPILDYQNEEGQLVEPFYYLPIIPMVLVNGSEGIGTGFSTNVPCYNPIDVIENIKNYLRNEEMFEMVPWYKGFKGTIERNSKLGFDVVGKYKLSEDMRKLTITELPINRWINDYREFLNSLVSQNRGKEDEDDGYITDYSDFSSNEVIDIRVNINVNMAAEIMKEGVEKVFKLKTTISTSNMTLFDSSKRIKRYESELEILKEFINTRVKYYNKRREYLIKQLQVQLQQLSNQVRFINMIINNELVLFRKSKQQIVNELKRLQFDQFSSLSAKDDYDKEEGQEADELLEKEGYNYLLNMSLLSLSIESINKLNNEYNSKQLQLKTLINTTSLQLYEQDLDQLKAQLMQTKLYPPTNKQQVLLNKQKLQMFKANVMAVNGANVAKSAKKVEQVKENDHDGSTVDNEMDVDEIDEVKYDDSDRGIGVDGVKHAVNKGKSGTDGSKYREDFGRHESNIDKFFGKGAAKSPEEREKLQRMESIEPSQIENIQYSQLTNVQYSQMSNDQSQHLFSDEENEFSQMDHIQLSQLELSQVDNTESLQASQVDRLFYSSSRQDDEEKPPQNKYNVSLIDRLNKKFNNSNNLLETIASPTSATNTKGLVVTKSTTGATGVGGTSDIFEREATSTQADGGSKASKGALATPSRTAKESKSTKDDDYEPTFSNIARKRKQSKVLIMSSDEDYEEAVSSKTRRKNSGGGSSSASNKNKGVSAKTSTKNTNTTTRGRPKSEDMSKQGGKSEEMSKDSENEQEEETARGRPKRAKKVIQEYSEEDEFEDDEDESEDESEESDYEMDQDDDEKEMETNSEILRKLGTQVSSALQEVGAQLKYHAKQAKSELSVNIDNFKTPICGRLANEVNCSLFPVPNSKSQRTAELKTSGNHTFGFDVKFHQQEIGLIVVSVTGVDSRLCKFSWRRRLHSYECAIDHCTQSTYKLTADDVGNTVVVRCSLEGSHEYAEAEIGPIDIDVRSKRMIQEALINNTSRHQLYLLEVNSEKVQSQSDYRHVVLYLLAEEVTLKPEDNMGFAWRSKCRFGTDFPRAKLDLEDELRFYLEFDADLKFTLRVYNRNQRDLVVLMLRVFHSRVLLNSSFENNQMELTRDGRLDQLVNMNTLSLNALVQRLSVDVSFLILENSRLGRELERAKQEKSFLELEMKSTIQVFQEQIANEQQTAKELSVEVPIKRQSKNLEKEPEDKELNTHRVLPRKLASQRGLSRQTTTTSALSEFDSTSDENQSLYADLVNRNAMLNEKLGLLTQENNSLQEQLNKQVGDKNRLEKQSKCALKDLENLKSENEQLQLKMGELRSKLRKLSLLDSKNE
ncbi:DNA topoisomerase 2 [Theileria orientalis strain Shintoku]|uniref:DNA topoisomerase (ATP-hydrolyzing) n=1 Tax=Theileria orientalis strain Shintoku TaxID=869250 RepID=J4C854_THEOR|nr:DNA topoisomerase 2 [Theileria orientalis strain Shintoku]BAM40193.1 DNA topoisomerase 2 [Theileria orientalis strain Shintoku]|eukprot:XP_009690494.1 DNA topoisomerase 2 [Theileria orientalis strain Shintoku]